MSCLPPKGITSPSPASSSDQVYGRSDGRAQGVAELTALGNFAPFTNAAADGPFSVLHKFSSPDGLPHAYAVYLYNQPFPGVSWSELGGKNAALVKVRVQWSVMGVPQSVTFDMRQGGQTIHVVASEILVTVQNNDARDYAAWNPGTNRPQNLSCCVAASQGAQVNRAYFTRYIGTLAGGGGTDTSDLPAFARRVRLAGSFLVTAYGLRFTSGSAADTYEAFAIAAGAHDPSTWYHVPPQSVRLGVTNNDAAPLTNVIVVHELEF